MRGRKPKPRTQHELDGTLHATKHKGRPPDPGGLLDERAPKDLPDMAQDFWRLHAPIINRMRIGKKADETALRQASMQWWRLQNALTEIRHNGGETFICEKTHNPKRLPAGITAKDMEDRLAKFYLEFGMTPISRERLAREPEESDGDFDF
jgi:P27 family predicted phage terminase small subunit